MKQSSSDRSVWVRGIQVFLPLVLLAIILIVFLRTDPLRSLTGNQPPVEELGFERVTLGADGITLHVVNAGPSPVTIAQVMVDDAYWSFSILPSSQISRLGTAVISIPYHWVEGEAHFIRLLTSTGATFDHEIAVAMATPVPDGKRWFLLSLIGLFVGVIPVALGLMWFPVLQRMQKSTLNYFLALTVGLLLFLFVDTLVEGIELAKEVPDIFKALPLLVLIAVVSYAVLTLVGRRKIVRDRASEEGRMWIAMAIAIGIGLHNFGEGMAVGASIAAGEAALGGFLVIGFVLHNISEGIGIGAPMAGDRPGLVRLAFLAVIAGGPAIVGTWVGGFSFTPFLAVIFFAVGAGAILQVVVEVTSLLRSPESQELSWLNWLNMSGVISGLAIMYVTALLV